MGMTDILGWISFENLSEEIWSLFMCYLMGIFIGCYVFIHWYRFVYIPLPSEQYRLQYLTENLGKINHDLSEQDILCIAKATENFNFADLNQIIFKIISDLIDDKITPDPLQKPLTTCLNPTFKSPTPIKVPPTNTSLTLLNYISSIDISCNIAQSIKCSDFNTTST